MITVYLGIDPGFDGALAFIAGDVVEVHDAPSVQVSRGRDYIVSQMVELVLRACEAADGGNVVGAVEQAIAMPKQSSVSTGKQFRGVGLWEGILAGQRIAYESPRPSAWKRAMSLSASKGDARVRAAQLFPEVGGLLGRTRDDGRAEALLLAEWLRRLRGGDDPRATGEGEPDPRGPFQARHGADLTRADRRRARMMDTAKSSGRLPVYVGVGVPPSTDPPDASAS